MVEAKYFVNNAEDVQCVLCPHNCVIKNKKLGICKVRRNQNNRIYTDVYNKVSALHVDPIEKKPLYHFFPGKRILSVGSIGCNLKCKFCQNWEISQSSCEDYSNLTPITIKSIIELANNEIDNIGLAFTYNEPTVWFEFMYDIAEASHNENLQNVMVTNGFINKEPLNDLLHLIDAFSIDLKAFEDNFYKLETLSTLEPVKETIKTVARSGKFLEITNLIIPGLNDDIYRFSEMINWIKNECGEETVLHLSRYFPRYKMNINVTPEKTLLQFYEIAKQKLKYVYLGNINSETGQNTFCPDCNSLLINRTGYSIKLKGINHLGNCNNCGISIIKNI